MLRVIVPDSHGSFIDVPASKAFINDLRFLAPSEIVLLGDHVDVSGIFSTHPANYVEDLAYSYSEDLAAASRFVDHIRAAAPAAAIHYLEGNHEQHLERWCSRTFTHRKDAEAARQALAPELKLDLKRKGIRYYRTSELYMGLSIPGTIRLGKCFFTHGYRAGKYATAAHLDDFGACVVHGHTHRSQAIVRRTAANGEIGAWCPGTLAQLQPLYQHNSVSSWSHGYGLQLVDTGGRFLHINVPISGGHSMLRPLLKELRPRRHAG